MKQRQLIIIVLALFAIVLIRSGTSGRFLVYAPLLLFGPGYLIERWLLPGEALLPRLCLWLGLSMAVTPLFYLWATALGTPITPFGLFIGFLLLAAGIIWSVLQQREQQPDTGTEQQQERANAEQDATPRDWSRWEHAAMALLILAVLALTGWTRLRHIDGLAFPPWVDSVHHALLTRVIAEQGIAPYSLRPYLPIDQLTYHWGYHAVAASLLRATGAELPTHMLWFGQLLSLLSVIAVGGCAQALWRRPLAAAAGIIPGVISIMPAYYLSWGRYTLLAGLLILLAALIACRRLMDEPRPRTVLLATLLLAGLSLVHFVSFVFALLWLFVAWLVFGGSRGYLRSTLGAVAAGGLTLLLTTPWLLRLVPGVTQATGNSPMQVGGSESYNAMPEGLLWAGNNRQLLAFAALSAYLALRRRRVEGAALFLWPTLVVLVANPGWFGLPYLSFFTNLMVSISLFVPVSLLIGGGAATLNQAISRRLRGRALPGWIIVRTALLLLLAGWYAVPFGSVVRSDTILATAEDKQALQWVAANLPADARFVVNTEGWLYDVPRGADGGWWLMPYAGRQTSMPPVIFTYGPPELVRRVKEEAAWLREGSRTPEELADFMRANGYTHAYATRQGKTVNSIQLAGSPLFEQVFGNEQVGIFQLAEVAP